MNAKTLTPQGIFDSLSRTLNVAATATVVAFATYISFQTGFYFRDQSFVSTRIETTSNMEALKRSCKAIDGCKGLSFTPDYLWASPASSHLFKIGAHLKVSVSASNSQVASVVSDLESTLPMAQKAFVYFDAPNYTNKK